MTVPEVPTPFRLWARAKRFGQRGFTVRELHHRCRFARFEHVRLYVRHLAQSGAVAEVGREQGRAGLPAVRYQVVRPTAVPPTRRRPGQTGEPERGRIQRALWGMMRGLQSFLVRELAWLATSPDLDVSADTAGLYVRRLMKAGLIIVVEAGERSRCGVQGAMPGRYALKHSANTGPEPLAIIGNHVFDPNLGRFVGEPIDDGEVAA